MKRKVTFISDINEVVEYVKDIIIKIYLFINYYLYYELNNGQPISIYTPSFLFAFSNSLLPKMSQSTIPLKEKFSIIFT